MAYAMLYPDVTLQYAYIVRGAFGSGARGLAGVTRNKENLQARGLQLGLSAT
jgi:hypothetical protein